MFSFAQQSSSPFGYIELSNLLFDRSIVGAIRERAMEVMIGTLVALGLAMVLCVDRRSQVCARKQGKGGGGGGEGVCGGGVLGGGEGDFEGGVSFPQHSR